MLAMNRIIFRNFPIESCCPDAGRSDLALKKEVINKMFVPD